MEDVSRQGEVINMTDPCLTNGPVQDPQLPRGGFFSAGGYVVVYDCVWASTIVGARDCSNKQSKGN